MGYSILSYRRDLGVRADDFMGLMEQCLTLGDVISQNLGDHQFKEGDLSPAHYIYAFNLLKASDTLISSAKLVDAGLVGDAKALARKILDIAINLKYMSLDIEKRQYQYWYYWTVLSKKTTELVLNDEGYQDSLKDAVRLFADDARKNFLERVHLFEKDSKGKPNLSSWSGLHISDMADKSGLGTDYRICYKLFSASTHGSIDDMLHYFDPNEKAFGPRFETSDALALILEVVRCYLIITGLVIDAFHLELGESHASVGNQLEAFRGDDRLPNWPSETKGNS